MTDAIRDLLTQADAYLTATHTARHDVIAAGGACAGCELRDEIRAAAAPASPSAPAGRAALRDRIAEALLDHLSRTADIRRDEDGVLAFMPEVTDPERMRIADAVLAVLPEPATGPGRVDGEAQQNETQADARETVEYFLQAQQDDGTWEDASSFMNAPDGAAERLAVKRARHPDFPWRMAQRTTTVTVRPLPDCLACRHWRCDGDGPCGALVDAWQRCTCPGPAVVSQPGKEG